MILFHLQTACVINQRPIFVRAKQTNNSKLQLIYGSEQLIKCQEDCNLLKHFLQKPLCQNNQHNLHNLHYLLRYMSEPELRVKKFVFSCLCLLATN